MAALQAPRNRYLCAILVCWACAGSAQTVYRCGTSYSQTPCPQAVEVQVDDSRTPQQKIDADRAAQRNAREADALEKDRLARERELAKVQASARTQEARRAALEAQKARKEEARERALAVQRKKALSHPGKHPQPRPRDDFKAVGPAKP